MQERKYCFERKEKVDNLTSACSCINKAGPYKTAVLESFCVAVEFYDPNSIAYIANINMAFLRGMLHGGSLRPRLGSNRFGYTTFTAGPMNFSHQCLRGMFGCEQRPHTVCLKKKKSEFLLLMGDDLELKHRGDTYSACLSTFLYLKF